MIRSLPESGPRPRPGVLAIAPYVGGDSHAPGVQRLIRLASNEGAFGPSPLAQAAYQAAMAQIHRYPDGGSVVLREAIAAHHGLDAARVVCGAGSDNLLNLLAQIYSGPGDEILYSAHGFLFYPIAARLAGATPVMVPEQGLKADIDALLSQVNDNTRIVFLANPNNPTGSYLSEAELGRLHAGLPEHVLLVVDAAYAEFVTESDYEPGVRLVDRASNVVMTRTFSKIYALGGLRLGWAYAPDGIIDALNRAREPFNVSLPAQAAGVAALEDRAFTTRACEHNRQCREWFSAQVRLLGRKVYPSAANFVLVEFDTPQQAEAMRQSLKSQGVLVRQVGSYGLPCCLRITIGTDDEMRSVLAILAGAAAR